MAKKSKGKSARKSRQEAPRRQERRFVSQTATNPRVVYALAWVSALLAGAGAWAYFYGQSFNDSDQLRSVPQYVLAAGIVLLGVTVWLGTSSEPPVRVGDPGVALEKGEIRRMPWWAVEKITFEPGALALVLAGKDEGNADFTLKVPVKAHPEAIGWIAKEALDRIPRRVDISDETLEKLPAAHATAGQEIELEPLQVVGKRCAATGKAISYEPDARVCRRCERVYFKAAVPKKCKCGNSLADLRPRTDDAADEPEEGSEQEGEDETAAPEEKEARVASAEEPAET